MDDTGGTQRQGQILSVLNLQGFDDGNEPVFESGKTTTKESSRLKDLRMTRINNPSLPTSDTHTTTTKTNLTSINPTPHTINNTNGGIISTTINTNTSNDNTNNPNTTNSYTDTKPSTTNITNSTNTTHNTNTTTTTNMNPCTANTTNTNTNTKTTISTHTNDFATINNRNTKTTATNTNTTTVTILTTPNMNSGTTTTSTNTNTNTTTNATTNTTTNTVTNTSANTSTNTITNTSANTSTNTITNTSANTNTNTTTNTSTNTTTNTSTNTNSNMNPGITNSLNSTMLEDDSSKHFMVIQDVPREGRCKRCPKMQLVGIKQWWKVQQTLAPRTRHSVRVALVVVGSVLLLLAIFLLARLPHTAGVAQNYLRELPTDNTFRPQLLQGPLPGPGGSPEGASGDAGGDVPPLPAEDHPDVGMEAVALQGPVPLPAPDGDLRSLANRKGVGFHSRRGVPVNERFPQLDMARRQRLAQKMKHARNGTSADVVLQLVRETVEAERKQIKDKEMRLWSPGETPLRILLVSTWRSGSTFLGQALQQHPGVFQHYEPFSHLGIKQIRSGTAAFQSQQLLHRLLECRFKGQTEYLNYIKHNPIDMIGHNKRIWEPCNELQSIGICSDADFLTKACNMFPIQLVKTVRLRLNLTQLFLGETRLNAKVVFLVRDPRATMNSRRSSVGWCDSSPDCSDPAILCSDLKEDLKVSVALERLYPNSFVMVRYEDLAKDPQNVIRRLLQFLGLEFSSKLSKFITEHTEADLNKPWSIARKSSDRIARWKDQLPSDQIEEIQRACKPVIDRLGYQLVKFRSRRYARAFDNKFSGH